MSPPGGSPAGRATAGRTAPLPQVGGPRGNAASMVAAAKGLAVLRARHSLTARITDKGVPSGRVATAMGASTYP
jgi:hypothetical protein